MDRCIGRRRQHGISFDCRASPRSERRKLPVQQPIPCEARPGQASPAVIDDLTAGFVFNTYTKVQFGRMAEGSKRSAEVMPQRMPRYREDLSRLLISAKRVARSPEHLSFDEHYGFVAKRYVASGPATNFPAFITPRILSRSRSTSIRRSGSPFRITRSASIPLVRIPTES